MAGLDPEEKRHVLEECPNVKHVISKLVDYNEPLEILAVIATLLDPFVQNLTLYPSVDRYRTLRVCNAKVQRLCCLVGGHELLDCLGLIPLVEAEVTQADGTSSRYATEGPENLHLPKRPEFVETKHVRRVVDALRAAAEEAMSNIARKKKSIALDSTLPKTATITQDPNRSQETVYQDKEEHARLCSVVSRTLHRTHRIRNHFTLDSTALVVTRVTPQTRNRAYACSQAQTSVRLESGNSGQGCPDNFLEVHWHTRTSNILYAYLFHLTDDGEHVLHNAPILGYQYDTDPRSATFQCTLHFCTQSLDLTGKGGSGTHKKAPLVFQNFSNVVVTRCEYCGKSFDRELWV